MAKRRLEIRVSEPVVVEKPEKKKPSLIVGARGCTVVGFRS